MRVAIVHEHLAQDGGAERVVMQMARMWPEAPIFTLLYDRERAHPFFRGRDVRTTYLQRLPFPRRRYQWLLPLMAHAVESLDLSGFDLVVSSSSAFAKGVLTPPDVPHVCYCHSPTRYLWTDSAPYVAGLPYARVVKTGIRQYLSQLRTWDRLAADRPDAMVANSRTVQQRIRKFYRRESEVVVPPVEIERFTPGTGSGGYFLAGGRLVPYKRFDLIVEAFNRLGLPLVVFGTGPEGRALATMAKSNVRFVGKVPDADLPALYANALAYLHPQEEDFGITPVEAMAAGRPVLAYHRGGAAETVVHGETGTLFEDQTWEALADTVIRFKADAFDPVRIRARAEEFSPERFRERFSALVERVRMGYDGSQYGA